MTDYDQLTFQNPVDRYREISPPKQDQPEPGFDTDIVPKADHGEDTYRGTGRLEGRKALITGADSGSAQQSLSRLLAKGLMWR